MKTCSSVPTAPPPVAETSAAYTLTPTQARAAHHALHTWYQRVQRPLPWRKTRDPYAIWVSEIMCQQTRVDTAIPYYQRWMAQFPTPQHLANAAIDDVLLLWQGLGYYRRARNLHKGAVYIVEHLNGQLPNTSKALQELPGIGPYTASAIASIAFEEHTPAIDGNLQRVLSRLATEEGEITRAATLKRLRTLAQTLLDLSAPGDTNQALMELGATVCTPTSPACDVCPLQPWCTAYKEDDPTRFPVKKKAKKQRQEQRHAYLAVRPSDQAIFMAQRHDNALLGGLWEAPLYTSKPRAPEWTAQGELRHLFTHIDLRVTLWTAHDTVELPALRTNYVHGRWVQKHELNQLPQSTLMRKIFDVYYNTTAHAKRPHKP